MKNPSKQTQTDLEMLFSKHQLLPVLREQFRELSVDYPHEDDHPFVEEVLAQIYLHRQADPETMVGILVPKFGEPQEVADRLLLLVELDYLDYDPNKKRFMVKYDVSEDVQDMLDRYQYPLPMVVKPNEVKNNSDTGYMTIRNSVILNGSPYFKDKDVCLDHLNRANSVPLALDMAVVESSEGKFIKPKRNPGEDYADFNKRMRQANTFYQTSTQVMADLVALSDEFFITHRYDRRGRCYDSGYHVNPQGTDYNKAVVTLANKEMIK